MHDVLDPRDLVTDEAEQLRLSGYDVGDLEQRARRAAEADNGDELAEVESALAALVRGPRWADDEPDEEQVLLDLAAAVPPVPYDPAGLADRVRGAWLGRTVGNTMGKPVEGLSRSEVKTYLRAASRWPQTGYIPLLDPLPPGVGQLHPSAPIASEGTFDDVPRDDDIDWTILGLHLLERHGRALTTANVAAAWLDRVPFTQTYTAERAAYRNLIHGLRPPATATTRNPYREWIGALIRADVFGYVNPGDPAAAVRLALVDARLSHTGNGLYGEIWAAGLVASALAAESVLEALTTSIRLLPPRSRLAIAIKDVMSLRERGADRVEALDHVDAVLSDYPWVHTVPNAALIVVGLLWGEDFADAVATAVSGGRDTDSTAATVGSVFGALHGTASVPARLVGTTHIHVRSAVRDFDRITVDELATRTLRLVRTP